uniref:Transposase-associated domain-containing protein n=1 Tax=Setaria italica TaxID=4555 RepID=K3XPY0_SETIT
MDRSWMKKARHETAYEEGVEKFLAFAYRDLPQDSEILCPCKKCKNRINQSHDEVRTHQRCDGILQGYTTWVHHGENYDRPSIAFVDVPNITTLPTSGIVQGRRDGESDSMEELLHAAFGRVAGMSQGEADDFQSGFVDMEHNAPEDIVTPAQEGKEFVLGKKVSTAKKDNKKGKNKEVVAESFMKRKCKTKGQNKESDGSGAKEEKNPKDWLKKSKDVMRIVVELSNFFKMLCSKVIDVDELAHRYVLRHCDELEDLR